MIQEIQGKTGTTYRVRIRKKSATFTKNFTNRSDAELYESYKTSLIECMDNFDIKIKDRVTLKSLFELKEKSIVEKGEFDKRAVAEIKTAYEKIKDNIKPHTFAHELCLADWEECLKKIETISVYRGSKKLINERPPSISTLRRYFAIASSVISHAIGLGIAVENYPLKVMQIHINPRKKVNV